MADALTGKTEVQATVEERVSTRVQEVLTATAVMPGTLENFPAENGIDTIKIPRFGNFTVDTKSENTAVDAQVNAFSTDDLALDQHKVIQFLVEDIASVQAKVAVTARYIDQAGRDLAANLDLDLIDTLESGVSAAAPDHRIAYANATDLQKVDILEAKRLLGVQNVRLENRFLLIAPGSEKSLLNISEFIRVNESGTEAGLRNGQIGRLFGFTVIMSSQAEDLKTLAYHSSTMALSRQISMKTEQDRDLANLADRWSVSHLYGRQVLDDGKRVVMLGTAA